MKNLKTLALVGAVSVGVLGSAGVMAANNPTGLSDTTSEGDFTITLFNDTEIRLFGLQDVTFVDNDASTAPSGSDPRLLSYTPVCVNANVAKYTIALGSTNNFALVSGDNTNLGSIDYTLSFTDKDGDQYGNALWSSGDLGSGVYSTAQIAKDGSMNDALTCSTTTSNKIEVAIPASQANVSAGSYSDIVTVEVSPI